MSSIFNPFHLFTNSISRNSKSNNLKNFIFIFFALLSGAAIFAQQPACTSMSTVGYEACFNQAMTFTVKLNDKSAGQPMTWIIDAENDINKENSKNISAFFEKTGTRTIHTTAKRGANSITVNTGYFPGYITVKIKFDAFPETGTCSSSMKITSNCDQ